VYKKLVLDEILCYIFNYTDVTGQIATEPQAARTILTVIADKNISIWWPNITTLWCLITSITLQVLVTCNFSLVEIFEGCCAED